jgi:hypothetical protein
MRLVLGVASAGLVAFDRGGIEKALRRFVLAQRIAGKAPFRQFTASLG